MSLKKYFNFLKTKVAKTSPDYVRHDSRKINFSKENKQDESDKSVSDEKKNLKQVPLSRVFGLNKPEWMYILMGCFAAIANGATQPGLAIILSKATGVFSKCDRDEAERLIVLYALLFIAIGVVSFLANLTQSTMFGVSGENMTKRLRARGFKTMLAQDVGWFDSPDNNVGKLCTRLSIEAAAVQGGN